MGSRWTLTQEGLHHRKGDQIASGFTLCKTMEGDKQGYFAPLSLPAAFTECLLCTEHAGAWAAAVRTGKTSVSGCTQAGMTGAKNRKL